MIPRTLNREQSRQVDRRAIEEYGISGLVLMENAGRGVVDVLTKLHTTGQVAICCGTGNNGGDGFVVARHLDIRSRPVKVLLFGDPARLTGDALANYSILAKSDVPIAAWGAAVDRGALDTELAGAEWIVDALLGTGAHGEPRPPLDTVIESMNAAAGRRLAIDVPSGLDCDTGQPAQHTIRAAHTCTFVAPKPGFFTPGAEACTGQIHVLDIGAPRKLVEEVISDE